MSIELIRHLEEVAARAWPAAVVESLDGWLLRFADGVTRRANSVWPNGPSQGMPFSEKLTAVEQFYASRGLPARYQMCPASQPPDLDGILAERGYQRVMPTDVQVATLAAVLECTQPAQGSRVEIADRLEEPWLTVHCQAEGFQGGEPEVRRRIMERVTARTGYAGGRLEGELASVGLGILEVDWLGVFCMGTRPEFRRRGAAQGVLHALTRWGQEAGAARLYLQVREDNGPALALYRRAGLETLYTYHYRELP